MDYADVPVTFEELREWRAEDGIPWDFRTEILDLKSEFLTSLEVAGCDVMTSKGAWWGPCTTRSGYVVDGEAQNDDLGTSFAVTVTATELADGSLPTGWITYDTYSSYDGGSWGHRYSSFQLTWAFEDPAGSGLGDEGEVYSSTGAVYDECGDGESASLSANWQGCDIGISWDKEALNDWPDPVLERESFALNGWSASVTTYACRSVVGVLDGRTAFLDDDWHEIARTDADGDLCAAEDCDCDDGDAAVSPNVLDLEGDGIDADCDGDDGSGWWCGGWDYGNRCDRDDGGPDDSGADDSGTDDSGDDSASGDSALGDTAPDDTAVPDSADTASATPAPPPDPGCGGCATPANPGAALLLALAALFRRRR